MSTSRSGRGGRWDVMKKEIDIKKVYLRVVGLGHWNLMRKETDK